MSTAPRHQRTPERRFTRNARRRATALLSSLALMASMGFAVPAAVADGDDAAGVVGPSSPAFQTLDVTAEPTDPAPEQTEDATSPAPETSAPVETLAPAGEPGDSAPSDVGGDAGPDDSTPGDSKESGALTGEPVTGNGNQTHNFGTFEVRKIQTAPICAPGYVYGLSGDGYIRQVTPEGIVTNLGLSASGVSAFNGIGIGSEGTSLYAYERTRSSNNAPNVSRAHIWEYDTITGQWANRNHQIDSFDQGRSVQFVAGAVNLNTGKYFIGGFATNGQTFRIWEYDPNTNTSSYKGHINTSEGASNNAQNNGDMAFDAVGNLFVVRGVGNTTTVFSVTAANIGAADGGLIASSRSASVTTMNAVNGVAFDSSGKAFLGSDSQLRSYDMPNWSGSSTVVSSGLDSTDLATCSSPPTITIEKYVENGRVNVADQFTLTLEQGAQTISEVTTAGNSVGLQTERIGPMPTVRGVPLDFSESAAGTTDLAKYASSYRCYVDDYQDHSASGNGTSGTITIPATGQAVLCQFFNAPLVADIVIHKEVRDVRGNVVGPGVDWTVGATAQATTGTLTMAPADDTQETNADGNASWSLTFGNYDDRATATVHEEQQQGYEFESGLCEVTHLNGSTRTVELDDESPHQITGIEPGDNVDCTYVNRQMPSSVTWKKVDDSTPSVLLGGSAWTITGPGFPEPGAVIEDCTSGECTELDQDPVAGQFKLEDLAWGTYTVIETNPPEGYAGSASFTFTVTAENAATVIDKGEFQNTRAVGSVAWQKVNDSTPKAHLAGSEWKIVGPNPAITELAVTDCVADTVGDCVTHVDKDHRAGYFLVEDLAWGDYTLTETKAPAGYEFEPSAHSFTIGADKLDHVFADPFVNTRRDGPNLPLTGGLGRDFFTMLGIGVLTAGVGTVGYFQIRDRRREVA